nr:PREDICTED: unconventional myosin-X-like [Latimeria chalumnae]|eukprot:XP_014342425.1 PREDICTED: unconventional myosin-X-like [Latimeria chalumnae]
MDNYFTEGSRVWLRENGQHFPSTVSSCGGGVVVFTTDYGQVFTYKQSTLTRQKVTTMHPTSVEGVEDMATLSDLHEGSIMYNLFQRYQQDNIYTYIGSILASVNPYKSIPGLYDHNTVDLYSKHHLGEISPHLFAVANECYRCLWKRYDNQCVLIRCEWVGHYFYAEKTSLKDGVAILMHKSISFTPNQTIIDPEAQIAQWFKSVEHNGLSSSYHSLQLDIEEYLAHSSNISLHSVLYANVLLISLHQSLLNFSGKIFHTTLN